MYGAGAKLGTAEWRLLGAGASGAVRATERGVTAGVNAVQRMWNFIEDAFASADDEARRVLGGGVAVGGRQ